MPATRRHPSSTNPRVLGRFSAADTTTWHFATLPQLRALTAESLRLHLSARNLTTGKQNRNGSATLREHPLHAPAR